MLIFVYWGIIINLKIMTNLNNPLKILNINKESGITRVLFNGTEFNEQINSNNLDMMWITFAGENFENEWFRLESDDLGWIRLHENSTMDSTDAIMNLAREQFPNERWGISTTQQMLLGNAMRDNF